MSTDKKGSRIAKFMAHAGLCSRRDAERWIEAGRVQVNGEKISSPALNVSADDKILVDGKEIKSDNTPRVYLFHKPRGYICSHKDPAGRPTVFTLLPPNISRVVSVGRLDMNSEGLLILTTDPRIADAMMRPQTGLKRTYKVRISGKIRPDQIAKLEKGITIEGIRYRPIEITPEEDKTEGRNTWITMTLEEGKNREIRKVMEYLGLQVSRLMRTAYGNFEIGNLPKKGIIEVPHHRVQKLLKELGIN